MEKTRFKRLLLLGASLSLASCASYDGRSLLPGQSTAADVESLMGAPAEKVAAGNGDTLWFYPRSPSGRETYAVRLSAEGRVRTVEQVLTLANVGRLVTGQSTQAQAREVLGPPNRAFRSRLGDRDVWEYLLYDPVQTPYVLYVQSSLDGIVREAFTVRDPSLDSGNYSN